MFEIEMITTLKERIKACQEFIIHCDETLADPKITNKEIRERIEKMRHDVLEYLRDYKSTLKQLLQFYRLDDEII